MNVQSPIRKIEAPATRVKPPQKRRSRGWLMLAALIVVILAGAGYWYYASTNSGARNEAVMLGPPTRSTEADADYPVTEARAFLVGGEAR